MTQAVIKAKHDCPDQVQEDIALVKDTVEPELDEEASLH